MNSSLLQPDLASVDELGYCNQRLGCLDTVFIKMILLCAASSLST